MNVKSGDVEKRNRERRNVIGIEVTRVRILKRTIRKSMSGNDVAIGTAIITTVIALITTTVGRVIGITTVALNHTRPIPIGMGAIVAAAVDSGPGRVTTKTGRVTKVLVTKETMEVAVAIEAEAGLPANHTTVVVLVMIMIGIMIGRLETTMRVGPINTTNEMKTTTTIMTIIREM